MTSRIKVALLMAAAVGGVYGSARLATAEARDETSAVARAATLEDLAKALTDRFVDPDVGVKYAAMLRANAKAGKYDSITNDRAFAEAVTADLQAVAFDGHLKVLPPGGAAAAAPSPRGPISESKTIEAAARLSPDVAYLRLGNFFGQRDAVRAIEQWLDDNQDAKTLIFDMRTHRGGGLAEMDVIFPRLFGKSQVLVRMDTRSGVGGPIGSGPTFRAVAAPAAIVRREHIVNPVNHPLHKARVFVLASGRTASAGEHFVLAMKRTGRATVIGETTNGAGNFGGEVEIAGNFSAWIPVGRTFDPDSNRGWDYVGIAPNVAVPATEALTEALVRSGFDRARAKQVSAQYGPPDVMVTSLRKAPASVPGI